MIARPALPLVAVLVGVPALAGAAEEVAHGPSWGLLAFQILNFGILGAVLYRYARRPVLEYVAQRSRGIRRGIEDAESRLREAEAELDELRTRLESFDAEARSVAEQAAEQAEAEKARGIERARAAAERIRDDARRVAEREIERARQELRDEAAALATELAAELLRERLTPDDDRRLVREFVERVERTS